MEGADGDGGRGDGNGVEDDDVEDESEDVEGEDEDPVASRDPAGPAADGSADNSDRRRRTELRRGRVSMPATMGYIMPEITGKLPGCLSLLAGLQFAGNLNGPGMASKVPAARGAQIAAYCAFCELSQDQSAGTAAAPGALCWEVLTSSDAAEK